MNESRSTGDVPHDKSNLARPLEQESAQGGQDEVQGSNPSKRDPDKPAEQKRKDVEEQGEHSSGLCGQVG